MVKLNALKEAETNLQVSQSEVEILRKKVKELSLEIVALKAQLESSRNALDASNLKLLELSHNLVLRSSSRQSGPNTPPQSNVASASPNLKGSTSPSTSPSSSQFKLTSRGFETVKHPRF